MTVQSRIPPELVPHKYKTSFGEFIGVGPNGNLWVDGCDVEKLAEKFGTPLYVISENQLRYTYRRFRDAFRSRYPDGHTELAYSIQAYDALTACPPDIAAALLTHLRPGAFLGEYGVIHELR